MRKPRATCRNCPDRKVGCHSTCKKYLAFLKSSEEYKEIVRKNKQEETDATEALLDGKKRVKNVAKQKGFKP